MAKGEETKKPKSRGALRRHKTLVAYSFILPNLIGFFVLTFIPIVFSILLSFCEWDSGNRSSLSDSRTSFICSRKTAVSELL